MDRSRGSTCSLRTMRISSREAAGTRKNSGRIKLGFVIRARDWLGALDSTHARVDRVTVFTIGHSTRSIDQFLELPTAQSVQRLVDVRTIPQSRHNPQFGRERL